MSISDSISGCMKQVASLNSEVERIVDGSLHVGTLSEMIGNDMVPDKYVVGATSIVTGYENATQDTFAHIQVARERLFEARAHIEMVEKLIAGLNYEEGRATSLNVLINDHDKGQSK